MCDNSIEYLLSFLAISRLGGVSVPVNHALKRSFLSHIFNNSKSKILIIDEDLIDSYLEIQNDTKIEHIIVVGASCAKLPSARLFSKLMDAPSPNQVVVVARESKYYDIGCIMYTSGTTGPAKGVLMPNCHVALFGYGTVDKLALDRDSCYYCVLPLNHANGLCMQFMGCLMVGCRFFFIRKFSASTWLSDIRTSNATHTNFLGVVSQFILSTPASAHDKSHSVRYAMSAPVSKELVLAMKSRFNINVVGGYGMTEVNIPLYMPRVIPAGKEGSCGVAYEEFFDVTVRDVDTDEIQPANVVGEICIRPKLPYCFFQKYNDMNDKTVESTRNLWFHTGDAAYRDEDGFFFFVDRIKDVIRVKGENLSSYEIEQAISKFENVKDCAAIAVKGAEKNNEDELMVVLVLKEWSEQAARSFNYTALLQYCEKELPVFALPRYITIVEEFPLTGSGKVQKVKLRDGGVTPSTFDRVASGYQVASKKPKKQRAKL